MAHDDTSRKDLPDLATALDALNAPPHEGYDTDPRQVQVVGRVNNGRIELDQDGMQEFARRFPDATMTFVAVNAPFDPTPAAAPAQ